jgi:D-lactate dehydrogenase
MFILSPIQKLRAQLKNTVPSAQIFTDPLYTLVKGTDAGFYRLIPQAVIRVENETEVVGVIKACSATGHSVTFKGGGTSLSGQTISRDVLIEIGDGFSSCQTTDGNIVNVQCGMTGAHVNNRLARYGRRIGPDPSSILSAKIGGIVANNASGGAFGIQYNSYTTLRGMRLILADGFILDTRDEDSRNAFSSSHSLMIRKLEELALRVKSDPRLYDRINRKYALKNTCGYGLNSLIDFVDPMDILCHLMVGSEGTLGFISEVSLQTVPEYPFKATTLVFFSNLREACEVTGILHDCRVTA